VAPGRSYSGLKIVGESRMVDKDCENNQNKLLPTSNSHWRWIALIPVKLGELLRRVWSERWPSWSRCSSIIGRALPRLPFLEQASRDFEGCVAIMMNQFANLAGLSGADPSIPTAQGQGILTLGQPRTAQPEHTQPFIPSNGFISRQIEIQIVIQQAKPSSLPAMQSSCMHPFLPETP